MASIDEIIHNSVDASAYGADIVGEAAKNGGVKITVTQELTAKGLSTVAVPVGLGFTYHH